MCPISYAQPVTHQITWVENGALVNETHGHTPHCGQPHPHPSLVHTNQFRARASLRIADNHSTTHHWRAPMKTPRRNHPAGRDRSMRGHIGRGDSTRSHDDADSGAKVEYRTSSTPAYTDGLDLHYSTNNALTTTQVRSTLRIADNHGGTHHWCAPTKARPHQTPHCGQLRLHQQWVLTHGPCSWRSRKS